MQDEAGSKVSAEQRELLAWLASRVKHRNLSQLAISAASGVDQSQVSRILAGRAKRPSPNLVKLCKYALSARAGFPEHTTPVPAASERLTHAILRVWDGTPDHAGALVDLLEAVKRVQRTQRRGSR